MSSLFREREIGYKNLSMKILIIEDEKELSIFLEEFRYIIVGCYLSASTNSGFFFVKRARHKREWNTNANS